MPILEKYVCDEMVAWIDHDSMDSSDLAVRRVNGNVSANGHFSHGKLVVRNRQRCVARSQREVGQWHYVRRIVPLVSDCPGKKVGLLSKVESLKLFQGTTKHHVAVRGRDEFEWHEPAKSLAVRGLNDEVGQSANNRIDNHSYHFATLTVVAGSARTDCEKRFFHELIPSSLTTIGPRLEHGRGARGPAYVIVDEKSNRRSHHPLKVPAPPFDLVATPLEVVGCAVAFLCVGKLECGTLSALSLVPMIEGAVLIITLMVYRSRTRNPLMLVKQLSTTLPLMGKLL